MPAQRIGSGSVALAQYDLVGSDSRSVVNFPCHAGLAEPGTNAVSRGERVTVAHMGPPLSVGGNMAADAVGTVGLTADEAKQIGVFIDEHINEHRAHTMATPAYASYVVRPRARPELAADGTTKYFRFSCVGFAIEAYRDAGIDFVVTDEHRLPTVPLDCLIKAYPAIPLSNWGRLNTRYNWGCDGPGPWPTMLPGYLFHALDHFVIGDRAAPPYLPQLGDEIFP